ncbi:SUKH-4 family immunity protein [Zavarzinella formosa]|uniref:SUKH-4 family immunity protein n=1 Tax=Zavarzinella formosa TaxID=360055 RepID=UPI000376A861|nr:SUKH-4 family immunity protein [Zavarzinella formosa]
MQQVHLIDNGETMNIDFSSCLVNEHLKKITIKHLEDVPIPIAAKQFFEIVGLPIIHDVLFEFEPCDPPLLLLDEPNGYWQIGFYDSNPICIKAKSGEILYYDSENMRSRFMNSNINAFAAFLAIYHQMVMRARGLDSQEQKLIANKSLEHMRRFDINAFENEECYWEIIFEQISYELS